MKNRDLFKTDNLSIEKFDFKKCWEAYKKKHRGYPTSHKINNYSTFIRVVKGSLKLTAHLWANSTGGVYLKGVGYLTLFRPLKKFPMISEAYLNNITLTHGYSYLLTHVTNLVPSDTFYGFNIRKASSTVKMDVYDNVLKGRRYTMNALLLKDYLKKRKNDI